MTPEVKEIYDALIGPSKAHYEALRERLVEKLGYDAFRDRQQAAIEEICSGVTEYISRVTEYDRR
jgi:hypothetical protein